MYNDAMTLKQWFGTRPVRGARARFVRAAQTSYETLAKVIGGEFLQDRKTAKRYSAATGGEVTVAELMGFPAAESKTKKRRTRAAA